jgi:putative ABC transport system permease protein
VSLLSRLTNVFRSDRLDSELDEELRFHIEERIEHLVAGGMDRRDAQRYARRRFGNRLLLRETSHDLKAVRWLDSILRDMRFGCRVLWKDRTAMGAAALSLVLALAACATSFLLIDALILRPLPVSRPERLFYLAWPDRDMRTPPRAPREHDGFSYPLYQRMRSAAGASLDLFGSNWPGPLNPVVLDPATGETELVRIAALSGNAFSLLGIRAAAGRLFNEQDDSQSASSVALLSHAFWTRRFGADPSIIGHEIIVGNHAVQIVGIVERSFTGLQPGYLNDVWIPLTALVDSKTLSSPAAGWIGVWGRIKPDQRAALQPLQAAFTNFRRDYAAQILPPGASAAQLAEFVNTPLLLHSAPAGADSIFRLQFARPLMIFGIFSGLLLLIAASNVANLFIARAIGRQREMALRIAIGAGRSRLLQQLLIESLLLAGLACAGAIALGAAAAPFLAKRLSATSFPSYLDIHPDWRLLIFMSVAGLLTTLFFGALPSLRASAVHPNEALKSSAKQSSGAGALRPLLVIQVAFSFMALFLSGLLLISFNKLIHVDLGFAKDHVILFTLNNTKALSSEQQPRTALQLLDRIGQIDGVRGASLSQQGPMGGAVFAFVMTPSVRFPGRAPETFRPANVPVSPGFFRTMRIPLLKGREFEARDLEVKTASAAVVNEAFSRRFFPGLDPIGQRFELIGDDKPAGQEVVGVVANSLFHDLREPAGPTIYTPVRSLSGATLEVRTAGNPLALAGVLRHAIEGASPALRVRSSILQSTRIDDTLVSERLLAWLGGFFAISAIVLVAVGLHGVISYSVVRRTKEIGIRMALGAERPAVVRFVVADVAVLICVGIGLGAASGIALARYVASLLFEVKTTEFWSLAAPLVCLLAACVVAAVRPATHAARVDPVIALRYE